MSIANALLEIPDAEFPPLPPIADATLARGACTQPSGTLVPRDNPSDVILGLEHYDKLAHVGDSLLGTAVTLLLQHRFPLLTKGGATALKAHLVSNHTIAQVSDRYGLHYSMIASTDQLPTLRAQTRNMANLFEARVAATYFDFLHSPKPGAAAEDDEDLPPLDKRTDGAAVDYLCTWLVPLFTPIAVDFYEKMELARIVDDQGSTEDDDLARGATMLLNEYMSRQGGRMPSYRYFGNPNNTKKGAQMIAAHKVAQQMGVYEERAFKRRRFLPTAL